MTDLSISNQPLVYKPVQKVRFVTAASLFDGHDASINIMRRILQASGCEVIHLGHNRSVEEIVNCAVQEDAHGIAISSYQGGHVEYFKYMLDLLRERGGGHIRVFGGGGGVIVPAEIAELHEYGVTRIFSPEDGQRLGLQGMINEIVAAADHDLTHEAPASLDALVGGGRFERTRALARLITALEAGTATDELRRDLARRAAAARVPTLGITGTGGAGKSSLTDELIRRFRVDQDDRLRIAVISIDPSRRKSGGALLGDRIRMNAIEHPNIYMRSLATRDAGSEIARALPDVIAACKVAAFDLVLVETSGIGQGDAAIAPLVDIPVYVMTPEFGAASQLEKIDMLDFAEFVAINKFDRKGASDALRDVRKQYQRNHQRFKAPLETMPVFGTIAARFNDDGVTALYHALAARLAEKGLALRGSRLPRMATAHSTGQNVIVPAARVRYLAEIAQTVREYHAWSAAQSRVARERQQLRATKTMLFTECKEVARHAGEARGEAALECKTELAGIDALLGAREQRLDPKARKLLDMWPQTRKAYSGEEYVVRIRDREIRTALTTTTLSGTHVPKVALPRFEDDGEILRWQLLENVPGSFPFTGGVFAFKRENEDPTRMFAGEGDPFRTNRRFHLLADGMPAQRLSTAFDSVTLYGCDPDRRPDIYGKVGNSGVSIATLDDMKVLYSGFDLCDPKTSVSMTINGPAPTILAMFMNTAIDQQLDKFRADNGRDPTDDEAGKIRDWTLSSVRGTVQADILKEDQGQNTCIFSTEFSLKVMGDIQEWFVHHNVRNFYSVSISGLSHRRGRREPDQPARLHAGQRLHLRRGVPRARHAHRRLRAEPVVLLLERHGPRVRGAGPRRAPHLGGGDAATATAPTSAARSSSTTARPPGRSLHAQEIAFNDIRTTLQALIATYDNANSLHTNAYDEAITTPTEESVRRAMAIQLVINREWGLARNENPNQGSFVIEALTDLVEEAVLKEFEAISERGGVLGAMETGYQRGKIQEESLYYEHRKHDGSYPIVGVNTFRNPHAEAVVQTLTRALDDGREGVAARASRRFPRAACGGGAGGDRTPQGNGDRATATCSTS